MEVVAAVEDVEQRLRRLGSADPAERAVRLELERLRRVPRATSSSTPTTDGSPVRPSAVTSAVRMPGSVAWSASIVVRIARASGSRIEPSAATKVACCALPSDWRSDSSSTRVASGVPRVPSAVAAVAARMPPGRAERRSSTTVSWTPEPPMWAHAMSAAAKRATIPMVPLRSMLKPLSCYDRDGKIRM